VRGAGRAVHEVPGPKLPFLAFDEQQALPGEDEKPFLVGLRVVEPARLSRVEHLERQADLGELVRGEVRAPAKDRRAAFEDASGSERVVREPRRMPQVDDEPAVAHGREP
jgi:hypothetical protein